MKLLFPCRVAVAAVSLMVLPALAAGDGPARKPAQAYSVYKDEGLDVQFDNPVDAAPFESLSELTRHLIRTAAQLSKYRLPDALPMVRRVERAELEQRGCPTHSPHCQVSALFEPTQGVMMAAELKPESNMFHRSILLHELVHYLQEEGGELATASPCERWYQREIEAYALQNRFLASVYSPERVSYAGARPTCESATHAHRGKDVKAPGATD